ncbi:MAG TPA: sporulation protein YqfD [Virgibacillus sp.]|nr:sporulation protein YqfD [Virgibacillus sp.]
MKHIQGAFITGYVTVAVKGNMPELFFQMCMKHEIPVWNIKKTAKDTCEGNIKLQDMKYIKQIKRETDYKISFIDKKGYPFLIKRFTRKKEILIALIMSLLLIIFLSNIIWEVKITGVPKDIEEKISKQLDNYGIHSGAWTFSLDSASTIQQQLVKDVPELLWVGVHKKGTTFFLEGVEKIIVKEDEVKGPRNLIATKKGVIQSIYVSKGLPKVQVNDYVEPGDVLVSGDISVKDEEEKQEKKDKEETKDQSELVAAEGDITAKTWYEMNVTIPLEVKHEEVTGNKKKKHYIRIGDFQLPIWGFKQPDYEAIHTDTSENPVYFFKWKLPIKIVESVLSEKRYNKVKRTKKDAIDTGIEQAKKELQLQVGPDAKILTEKVLHETTENGKVKLNLYIAVEENIAKSEPIKNDSKKKK